MSRSKTHEQFIEEMFIINPNIKILSRYVKSKEKVLCKCLICKHEWEVTPTNLLKNRGCPVCAEKSRRKNKTKSNEQFLEELKSINKNILPLEEYTNCNKKIKVRCLIDEYEWCTKPANLLSGFGCSKCGDVYRKNTQEFIQEMKEINPNIEILGEYINNKTKIKCKCKICNYEWKSIPSNLLRNEGCFKCGLQRLSLSKRITNENFVKKLNKINPNIIPLEEYELSNKKILCKCKICNNEWKVIPSSLLMGFGCPNCNLSKLELRTKIELDLLNINYLTQYKFDNCRNILPLPFDFYLPDYNILIEVDGIQHFESVKHFNGENGFKKTKYRDNIKNKYCEENNIKLIRIPYWEIDNIKSILEKELNKVNQ